MQRRIEDLIARTQDMYPEGLSTGNDNTIKYDMYNNKVPKELWLTRAQLLGGAVSLVNFDHYTTMIDEDHVYVYSQPYSQRNPPQGWEEIVFVDDSWYYPKAESYIYCVTQLLRAPISMFSLYRDSDTNSIIILPLKYKQMTARERKYHGVRPIKGVRND